MTIDVIETAKDICKEKLIGKTAIIIDVLRATSVMTTAIANGVKAIYPYRNIEDVIYHAKQCNNPLLCGERKGLRIEGFDCGNSPLEFTPERVKEKIMYMTTSNGTRAIENASKYAEKIYIGSFLNLQSIVNRIVRENKDVTIVCSGTNDEFSLDDALCAGKIIKRAMEMNNNIKCSDIAIAHRLIAIGSKTIPDTLEGSKHYEYLKSIGFFKDLDFCFTIDKFDIVPEYINGSII